MNNILLLKHIMAALDTKMCFMANTLIGAAIYFWAIPIWVTLLQAYNN